MKHTFAVGNKWTTEILVAEFDHPVSITRC